MVSPVPRPHPLEPAPARFPWGTWGPVGLAVAGAAAYANSLRGALVFDDQGTLVDNPTLRSLWEALFPPNNGIPVAGRPVANVSFALNRALTGGQVWGYHAGNLLIHLAAALCLFGIVRLTLQRGVGSLRREAAGPLAFAIALFWAVHPLTTEAVTYLSQRVESLMGLFYLLTLYASIRAGPGASRAWYALSVAACLLGMGTKEVMVTAPVLVFLYDWTFRTGSLGSLWHARRRYYLALAATWLPLFLLVAHTGTRGGTAGFGSSVAWWAYGYTQIRAVAHYLRLALWPAPLIADYGRILGGPPVAMVVDFLVLTGLILASLRALWRRSPWGFLGAWFFVILAPSSSIVPVATEFIAERRAYLSLAAVVTAVVIGAFVGWQALGARAQRLARAAGSTAVVAVALALATATFLRNEAYGSVLRFWRDVAQKLPENAGARNNYGNALAEAGDLAGAEQQYRASLDLMPAYADAHFDLGNVLVRQGHPEEAIDHYKVALQTLAGNPAVQRALGVAAYRVGNALLERGQLAGAAEYYRTAVTLRPDLADAHANYGGVLAELGRTDEAVRQLSAALTLEPAAADVHNNLGGLFAQTGRLADAQAEFEAALKLKPDYPEAQANLAKVRRLQGGAP